VEPIRYQIRVRGRLTERLGSAFAGMTVEAGEGQTALVGEICDQSHLYGILERVRSLGLELVSVAPDTAYRALPVRVRATACCLVDTPSLR
jgi:hypothetical protein